MTTPPAARTASSSAFGLHALHLLVLSSFAIAQPLYDLLGRYATFFVAHDTGPAEAVLFVLAVSLGPAVLLVLVEGLVGLCSARLRGGVHLLFVATLVALVVLPPLNRTLALPTVAAGSVATVVGALAALAYARRSAVRSACTVLGVSVPLFPALFLFTSPVRSVMRAPQTVIPQDLGRTVRANPVVVVIFDELSLFTLLDRQERIDPVRFPNFAALAHTATWYRNATTVADNTPLAVPAILTGMRPDRDRVPIAREHPRNLFTLLGGVYGLEVVEPVTELCPRALCRLAGRERPPVAAVGKLLADAGLVYLYMLAPPDLRARLPNIAARWTFGSDGWFFRQMLRARQTSRVATFAAFLRRIEGTDAPMLYFAHVLLPHRPYEFLPSGMRYLRRSPGGGFPVFAPGDTGPDGRGAAWQGNALGAAQQQKRYLLQVGLVDRLLGRLLARLRHAGLFDSALLVITADHGISFRADQSQRFVTDGNHVDVMWVPLFIKAPGQRTGRVDDRNVESIDVLPTIADLVGIGVPWDLDGESLLRGGGDRADKRIATSVTPSGTIEVRQLLVSATRPRRPPALVERLRLFGTHTPVIDLLREGPHAELIGHAPAPRGGTDPAGFVVTLANPEAYRDVRPASGIVPAFVRGRLEGNGPPPRVAVALNGVVRGTTAAYVDALDRMGFGVVVPEQSFRSGVNVVDVYVIRDTAGGVTLHQMQVH